MQYFMLIKIYITLNKNRIISLKDQINNAYFNLREVLVLLCEERSF